MKVSRQNVWEESLIKLGRAKEDVCKPIKVQFIGEPAVDQSGPLREYFGLVNSAAQERLMSQSVFKHNISALQQREYYAFGQLTALGLLQGSPGPRYFSRIVVDYILTGNIEDLMPSIAEIPNHDIKTSLIELEELSNQSTADEFREKASFESGFRFESGYTKPFVTMSDKDEFLRCIALHYMCLCH
ncbi:G2 M phase-specific E3 ubiquitin- ligase-like [Paramuricea clavata]|uniref:G2 M phase-specific E3 ubiquitin- ligase-like n=1 Tax=Paramuricea clavata TaxID=317549 RepID=A0A7D9KE15_PARCT|nr:G2 M phase-specific E3 ubiquitin- ligase-like [Paramuricea clavata]